MEDNRERAMSTCSTNKMPQKVLTEAIWQDFIKKELDSPSLTAILDYWQTYWQAQRMVSSLFAPKEML